MSKYKNSSLMNYFKDIPLPYYIVYTEDFTLTNKIFSRKNLY